MSLKELEKKIENMQKEINNLKDIEQINKLQRAYGYYMDNLMYEEAADLFADECYAEFSETIISGNENIRNSFRNMMNSRPDDGKRKLFLHMQLQGVVDVDDNGQTAKGRWQMLCLSTGYLGKPPGELEAILSHGVYENEYIKNNDIWKINRLIFNSSFHTTLKDGWVKTISIDRTYVGDEKIRHDFGDRTWRSGYKMPLHFKNPVTGQ
jgi:SnoaL-like domain